VSRGSSHGKVVLRAIQWRFSNDINPLYVATPKARPQIHLEHQLTWKKRLSFSFCLSRSFYTNYLFSFSSLSFSHEMYFASPRGLPDPKFEKKGHTPLSPIHAPPCACTLSYTAIVRIAKSLSIFELFLDRWSSANWTSNRYVSFMHDTTKLSVSSGNINKWKNNINTSILSFILFLIF